MSDEQHNEKLTLENAIRALDSRAVKRLVALKANLRQGNSLLCLAATQYGPEAVSIVRTLLRAKVAPEIYEGEPAALWLAAKRGRREIVKVLLDHKANPSYLYEEQTPLLQAIRKW